MKYFKKLCIILIILCGFFIKENNCLIVRNALIKTSNSQYEVIGNFDFSKIIIEGEYLSFDKITFNVYSPNNIHFKLIYFDLPSPHGRILTLRPLNKSIEINMVFNFSDLKLRDNPHCHNVKSVEYNSDTKIMSIIANTNEFTILIPIWWETRILFFMGLLGFIFVIISPTYAVMKVKAREYEGLMWAFMLFIFGCCFIISWLWG